MNLKINNLNTLIETLAAKDSVNWLKEYRQKKLTQFYEAGIPNTKHEDWKYTNLSPLTKQTYTFAEELEQIDLTAFQHYHNDDINIVFINGVFCEKLSELEDIPEGVVVSSLEKAIAKGLVSLEDFGTNFKNPHATPFVTLNDSLAHQGSFIKIKKNIKSSRVIHIVHVATPTTAPVLSVPRIIINLEESAEAHILESHLTVDDHISYLANPLTDIFIKQNAFLYYGKMQRESIEAFHVGTTRVWQEHDSQFDGFSLMSGGALVRNNIEVLLNGEGAHTAINGFYSVRAQQHVDNHTSIEHRAANCTSHQLYKGILHESSRAVFNGKIIVQPEAQLTNSYQLNKNLLLGTDCRIDTKPQLEIFADDVKCSHGATIGQLNADELFYLKTRCIGKQEAIRMLSRGFVDDVLATIKSQKIWKKLQCKIPH
ncbi:Iron-sulfur cluster assembly protein SufD [hydrothermal vent metagenome]|uniref:Iron-sulfur cluster assembly protein SufD n=1 Tax=hydrothermal vent metagenome TaxID=652676 RepID=A0A3B1E4J5_9ZZZZ